MERCEYSPQISPGNPNLTPMPTLPPVNLVAVAGISLGFPYFNPTTALTLRNPQFNDKLVKKYSRIQRNTRGNTLIVYRDTSWPQANIINYSFIGLSKDEANDALDFYKLSAGKYIRLLTYESLLYKGIILNPNNPVSKESANNCSYTLKFDFQGELAL